LAPIPSDGDAGKFASSLFGGPPLPLFALSPPLPLLSNLISFFGLIVFSDGRDDSDNGILDMRAH